NTKSNIHSSGPIIRFLPGPSSSISPSIDLTSSPSPPSQPTMSASTSQRDSGKTFRIMGRRSFMRDRIDGNVTTVDIVMLCRPVKQLQINESISMRHTEYLIPKHQLTQNSPLLTIIEDHRFVLMSCAN